MSHLAELAEDFDKWRDVYDDLTFEDQKVVYERIRELHPNQRHFTLAKAYPFFDRYPIGNVLELGGWDGWLAACVLGQHEEIERWVNYDLVEVPSTCVDHRYLMRVLEKPFWKTRRIYDAFVATHTIEHMKARELEKVVASVQAQWCLIEAPIEDKPTSWDHYQGTHVLEIGWDGVDEIFSANGYKIAEAWKATHNVGAAGRYYVR